MKYINYLRIWLIKKLVGNWVVIINADIAGCINLKSNKVTIIDGGVFCSLEDLPLMVMKGE